jgi:mRNA interferase HigB
MYILEGVMHVISKKRLIEFYTVHSVSKSTLLKWFQEIKKGSFQSIAEIRLLYPHADKVGRRTVFNIRGNEVRLITRINYLTQKVFIVRILTPAEYDKNDWK